MTNSGVSHNFRADMEREDYGNSFGKCVYSVQDLSFILDSETVS